MAAEAAEAVREQAALVGALEYVQVAALGCVQVRAHDARTSRTRLRAPAWVTGLAGPTLAGLAGLAQATTGAGAIGPDMESVGVQRRLERAWPLQVTVTHTTAAMDHMRPHTGPHTAPLTR